MKLRKEITELLTAGVINQETAEKIENYYLAKAGPPQNKLVIVFGILGALLVSLGIILILAHNWDELSRSVKTVIAFIPLVFGQGVCFYSLWKKEESTTWREASSTFLIISIGACISLIGQIYNIPGALAPFLFTWAILSLPVVYVMRSSVASLLYLIGITFYGCQVGYWDYYGKESYLYWGLLLLVLPHYYYLFKHKPGSNFLTFHNWFIPLSVIITLGTVATEIEELMFVAYMSLFGLLYLIGNIPQLRDQKIRNNGYLVLGSLGTVGLLLALSFYWFWSELRATEFSTQQWMRSPEFIASVVITLLAVALLVYQKKNQSPITIKPVEPIFILFIGIFFIGLTSPFVTLWINLLILAIGIMTIREGARENHFGILNYGLLIVSALIICRFFDTDLNFILKGVLFVAVGFGFFFANYWMAKRKKVSSAL